MLLLQKISSSQISHIIGETRGLVLEFSLFEIKRLASLNFADMRRKHLNVQLFGRLIYDFLSGAFWCFLITPLQAKSVLLLSDSIQKLDIK